MINACHIGAVVAIAIGLAAGMCGAQVRQVQVGQALDSNYQIGSGGYNSVNGGTAGVNAQLYINGQVTGLATFRGRVGYYAADQINLQLPSDAMRIYRGQSVGMQDVLSDRVYQTAPYYAPSVTIINSQQLASGQSNIIGGIDRTRADVAAAEKLYINAMADYQPLLTNQQIKTLDAAQPARVTTEIPNANVVPPVVSQYDQFAFRPGSSALFGVASVQGRDQLARELAEVDRRLNTQVDAMVDASVGPGVNDNQPAIEPGKIPGTNDQYSKSSDIKTPENIRRTGKSPDNARSTDAGKTAAKTSKDQDVIAGLPGDMPEPLVRPNQDIFMDLLVTLQSKKTGRAGSPAADSGTAPGSDLTLRTPSILKPDNTALGGTNEPAAMQGRFEKPAVEMTRGSVVIHDLAGASADQFNKYMAAGQKKLKSGKFYDAANQFGMAGTIRSLNPLAKIGEGISYFAAGEPGSSALYFQRAINMFPPIMETRIDVLSMIDKDTFDRQLARTEARIAEPGGRNELALLMTATYLTYQVGQDDKAKTYAEMLKKASGVDKVSAAFADYVLTGKKPATQPAAGSK